MDLRKIVSIFCLLKSRKNITYVPKFFHNIKNILQFINNSKSILYFITIKNMPFEVIIYLILVFFF